MSEKEELYCGVLKIEKIEYKNNHRSKKYSKKKKSCCTYTEV